jgi:hypothetical protein
MWLAAPTGVGDADRLEGQHLAGVQAAAGDADL